MDIHVFHHRLKLKKDAGDTELFENRDLVAYPACGEPFADLLTSEKQEYSFRLTGSMRLCVVRKDDRLLVFTHE